MNNLNTAKDRAKQAAAKAAVAIVENGMLVGLGTGSTAHYFIQYLIDRCRNSGLKIKAVATSQRSSDQAQAGGIPLLDINTVKKIDLTIDGADEIDRQKRMIKGGGGALLREKIIASSSREMAVIIDEEKLVDHLGGFPLPVEVVPFAHELTRYRLGELGYKGSFRLNPQGGLYLTDNQNYIIDIAISQGFPSPEKDDAIIRTIPGVVETGFFFKLAKRVFVGHPDGSVEVF